VKRAFPFPPAALLLFLLLAPPGAAADERPLGTIKLPPGFQIEVYADNVPNARAMALGDKGTLFVGSRSAGNVYAVLDNDQNGRADEVLLLAQGMEMPVGVAFHAGDLYFSAVSTIFRFDDAEANLRGLAAPVPLKAEFPLERSHGWKFIAFGPDGKLYVPVGAPCNVCSPSDPVYSSITRVPPEGGVPEIFAHGVRNTVGFDWHPETGELWFTDNGRDWMGDDLPPDELNRAPEAGLHFGFPFCHGKDVRDPQFGKDADCGKYRPAAQELGAHVAALGMAFYTGNMFPEEYRNQIFIAEHGSWNRSSAVGYRVTLVKLEDNRPVSYEPFAEGWLTPEGPWGRPVDVLVMPDGSLLVSDDHSGAIYRIRYSPE
jgi:glucose/arabinose dehydrogenase